MIGQLPALNAILNSLSAVLLSVGFIMILNKNVRLHRICMVSAFVVSSVFLVSYLVYHANVGHVRYPGLGIKRTIYFTILLTHTVLAATIVPLVLRTLFLALKNRFAEHRQWARWTFPIWFYVSVSGVVIYEMLY